MLLRVPKSSGRGPRTRGVRVRSNCTRRQGCGVRVQSKSGVEFGGSRTLGATDLSCQGLNMPTATVQVQLHGLAAPAGAADGGGSTLSSAWHPLCVTRARPMPSADWEGTKFNNAIACKSHVTSPCRPWWHHNACTPPCVLACALRAPPHGVHHGAGPCVSTIADSSAPRLRDGALGSLVAR